jgi:cell division protein ZipA
MLSVASLAILTFSACNSREEETAMPDPEPEQPAINGMYLSTASESAARARQLPTEPSEDVSSLLGQISLPTEQRAEVVDYLPNSTLEWVVHAALEEPLKAKEVASRFDKNWRAKFGGLVIYGLDTATGHWTFLVSADGPEAVSKLQFAWTYFASWSGESNVASPEMYRARLAAIERELNEITPSTITSEVDPEVAHERAKKLRTLTERFDRSVAIRLAAPSGKRFLGREIWDVMLCLGLQWGDMDCFHWQNPSGYGDDFFFSVWTSTQPGYFLPEEVAADRVNVEDLVFGYSIPRSADPVTVYSRMLKAVEYAQDRLGGSITSEDGRHLDAEAALTEIKTISDELDKLGFRPGSNNALRQF